MIVLEVLLALSHREPVWFGHCVQRRDEEDAIGRHAGLVALSHGAVAVVVGRSVAALLMTDLRSAVRNLRGEC